ncbi:hypothetical protein B566_EDAN005397 [Ephemera danica]|nr:hypothetical protein B566_EDAN005397 [Ephemera danica]
MQVEVRNNSKMTLEEKSPSLMKFCWVLNARQATVAFTIFNQILLLLLLGSFGYAWFDRDSIVTSDDSDELVNNEKFVIKAGIIILLVKLTIGILVLTGAVMKLRWCLLPYMILTPISLGLALSNFTEKNSVPVKNAETLLMFIACLGIVFGLVLYTLLATTVLYYELMRESRRAHALPCNLKQYAQTQRNKCGPAYVSLVDEPTFVSTGSH